MLPHTTVITNPTAGNNKAGKLWPQLRQGLESLPFQNLSYHKTKGPGHASELCRNALQAGSELIISIGGDGTLNEVVNGLFQNKQAHSPNASVAIIPIGTGGDYRRTFGHKKHWQDAIQRIKHGRPHPVDVGFLECLDEADNQIHKYFANITSFGASGLIDKMVNSTTKVLGGKMSFYIGTLRGLKEYKNAEVQITIDKQAPLKQTISLAAVAIGTSFGGGMKIAPHALADDGLFEIVIVGDLSMTEFIKQAKSLYQGTHLHHPKVSHFQGKTISAHSSSEVYIDMDGETPGKLPASIELIPHGMNYWY